MLSRTQLEFQGLGLRQALPRTSCAIFINRLHAVGKRKDATHLKNAREIFAWEAVVLRATVFQTACFEVKGESPLDCGGAGLRLQRVAQFLGIVHVSVLNFVRTQMTCLDSLLLKEESHIVVRHLFVEP